MAFGGNWRRSGFVRAAPGGRPTATAEFVFRPMTGLAVCLVWGMVAIAVLLTELHVGWFAALGTLPAIAFGSSLVHAVFGRPRVVVRANGVLLRNVLRDVYVPFAALADLDTRYALTLRTVDGRRFRSWAAPAAGRIGAARLTEDERRTLSLPEWTDEIPASAGLRSDAGAAAVAIRRSWRPGDRTANAASARDVEIRWAATILRVMAVCGAGFVITLIR